MEIICDCGKHIPNLIRRKDKYKGINEIKAKCNVCGMKYTIIKVDLTKICYEK